MPFDENRVFREVTLKVTGSLDLGNSLVDLRAYLRELMPLDEIILVRVDDEQGGIHQILRVTGEGLIGEPDQLLFLLDKEKGVEGLAKDRAAVNADAIGEITVLTSEQIKALDLGKQISILGIPESADVIALYNPGLNAGLVAVSYEGNVYGPKHVSLFKLLRDPFYVALANALRYTEIQKNRDDLQDDNLLFREVTVRLTGEHDIGKAFHKTLCYMKKFLPLNEIMLVTMNEEVAVQRMLLRVSQRGVIEESAELILPDDSTAEERGKILENLPDTFVKHIGDDADDFIPIGKEERAEKLAELGFGPDISIMVIGVKAARAGIVFISDEPGAYNDRHLYIVNMLKEPFIIALYNAIRFYEIELLKNQLAEDNLALHRDIQREVGDRVIGMHEGLKHVMAMVSQVARTPSPVLLIGETGSGKEVIATAIHRISDRGTGPFISLNCGAIPESLVDSELFGHERGAFTGANERKRGRFERADKGTLFLDEVGELPLSAQVKLLRVLQEKEFERVGGSHTIRADVRLVAATNRDLPSMVRRGQFREDLWFRLNVFPLEIPPLRARRQDIPSLAYHFIETKSRQLNLPFRPTLPPESLEKLVAYDWPGNVRELQNAIERALILSRGEPLRFPYLETARSIQTGASESEAPSEQALTFDEAVASYLSKLLYSTGGRIAGPRGAAALAGLNPSTFRSKMKKYRVTSPFNRGDV